MTTTFGCNSNNDIYLGPDGNIVVLAAVPAVETACANVSKVRLGEEVLDINGGLPFFEAVFNSTPNLAVYEQYLRNALLSVPGVVSITDLTVAVSNGILSYKATIESAYGPTFLEG